MENKEKRGNKTILIVILIIAVAVAGILVYRSNAIKSARENSIATIESFDTSKYDGDELKDVESIVDKAIEKLNGCKDKEEFSKIVDEFNASVAKIKTTEQKEKAAARKKAKEEAARKAAEAAAQQRASTPSGNDANECVGGGEENFY